MAKLKLAVATNILPPYRVALFNYLADQPDVALKVFACAQSEPDRNWNLPTDIRFDYQTGSTFTWARSSGKPVYINPGLVPAIKQFNPSVVLAGGTVISLTAWFAARLSNASFFLWSDATAASDLAKSSNVLKPIKRFLIKRADGFLASSTLTADYFKLSGASAQKIKISMLAIDVKTFSAAVNEQRKNRELLRRSLGISGPLMLFVGQLESYKGPDLLLETYASMLDKLPGSELLYVGTGSMIDRLRERAKTITNGRVHFAGFKQIDELPPFYAMADLFCLTSRQEPFGVVVAEALAAGLPVVCSKHAGAAYDLVQNNVNGFTVDPEEIMVNAKLMTDILNNQELRRRMSANSMQLAEICSIEKAGDAMLAAVRPENS